MSGCRHDHYTQAPQEDPEDRANFNVTKYARAQGLGIPVAVDWYGYPCYLPAVTVCVGCHISRLYAYHDG